MSTGCPHFSIKIKSHVSQFFLHITHDLAFRSGSKGMTTFGQDFHHVLSEISASEVQAKDGVGQSISLVDWHDVRDAIARVQNDASCSARRVEGEHSLDGDVQSWNVEGLKHDLCHSF